MFAVREPSTQQQRTQAHGLFTKTEILINNQRMRVSCMKIREILPQLLRCIHTSIELCIIFRLYKWAFVSQIANTVFLRWWCDKQIGRAALLLLKSTFVVVAYVCLPCCGMQFTSLAVSVLRSLSQTFLSLITVDRTRNVFIAGKLGKRAR